MKYRPPKQAVLDTVGAFSKPFTVDDLFGRLRETNPGTSRATVYRTLNRLLMDGEVRPVILPSGSRVFLTSAMGTKTVLYCEDCHSIACLSDDQLAENIHRLVKEAGLEMEYGSLCLSVRCGKDHHPASV